ncbi:CheY-like chemotaxis protein [Edaphobacter modestus]|uniref:CheY-like chemotaxis protein n=1 Tax=Edaphobacter modestus TaxID=388466 RepID=A0A4Q7YZ93_9BACT|nr:CheY-like chemotaxis protein [Edaphobacter modestus]
MPLLSAPLRSGQPVTRPNRPGRTRGERPNHPGERTQTSRSARLAHPPERHYGCPPEEVRLTLRPKKTILCVDDNEQTLSVRTFLLETRGYRVIPALSPQHALEVVEQSIPGSLDLLLSDLNMPQMDGNELVRRAKQLQPALPAMIVSGTTGSSDRACCADVFLPKGASSPAEMIERIRILVARKRGPKRSHITPRVAFDPAIAS